MSAAGYSAQQRAERCFALARSTTFDGERETAIAMGMRIASAAGLDLDAFEIPGRRRAKKGGGSCRQCGRLRGECLYCDPCHDCAPPCDKRTGRPFAFYTSEAGQPFDSVSFQEELDRWVAGGRQEAPPPMWERGDKAPRFYTSAHLREAMTRFQAAMEASADGFDTARTSGRRFTDAVNEFIAQAADAGSGVAGAFEAGRLAAAMRKANADRANMLAQHARWPCVVECASFLFSRGVPVYDMGAFPDDDGDRWFAPGRDPDRLDDGGLRDLADEVAG